jgi:hypothetical protein
MKKKIDQKQQGEYQNELVIIRPDRVRLSKKGDTVMVFLNRSTVMMFSKKFLIAVMDQKFKRGA